VVVAGQPVTGAAVQPDGLVVMAAGGVFTPGVCRVDGAHRQERARPLVTVGTPPHLTRPERAHGSSAVAFALVGEDAAAPERNRDGLSPGRKPAPAAISGGGTDPDRRQQPITAARSVSI